MKKTVIVCLILLILCAACAPKPLESGADYELRNEVNQLFNRIDFDQARSLLNREMDEGLRDVVALQQYAFIEYKIFQDYATAKAALEKAVSLDPDSFAPRAAMGEMYFHQGSYSSAIEELNAAAECKGEQSGQWDNDLSRVFYLLGRSHHALAENAKAIECLEASMLYNPYRSEASSLLHRLYVEEENYSRAYETWKIENRILPGEKVFLPRIAEYNDLYSHALAGDATHKRMAELYSALHLYDEALIEYEKAAELSGEDADITKAIERIEIFIDFRNQLAAFFEEYYRERCQGGADFNSYERLVPIYSRIADLLGETQVGGSKSWLNQMNRKIAEEFGFAIDFVTANGMYFGLHFGYIADDIITPVTQWGRTGEFRLIVLKNMISNGLFRWLTDGMTGVGGWNLGDNQMYVILESTSLITSLSLPDEETLAEMRHQDDINNKGIEEIFYSQALFNDLYAKQMGAERHHASESGIAADLTETYIVNRFQDSILFTTIVHEGQHAVDQDFSSTEHGEYEYRAKLSELAYGDMQYRALANMHSSSLGSDIRDTHTVANTLVYRDIVRYILENRDQFLQINTAQNIMLQLHELSEEQIKQIAVAVFENKYPEEAYRQSQSQE